MNKRITYFFIAFIVSLTSCKMQDQVRSFNQILSPSAGGNVAKTLSLMDSIDRFKNPILNRKYQQTKKLYSARFVELDEPQKNSTKNKIINDICHYYKTYWSKQLMQPAKNLDSTLYDNIAHYLVDNQLTDLSFQELSNTIIDDEELTKVIENQGYYCRFLLLNGIQDLLIWKRQNEEMYTVTLPQNQIDVNVIYIDEYVLKGYTDYATLGSSKIGGWASSDQQSLFCNRKEYRLNSEKFKVSYLQHESIHFTDLKNYKNLSSADLEYRAKLVELIYCTKKTIYDRIDEFIIGASNQNRDHSHPYANYHVIRCLSQKLFQVEFETDILKWKSLSPEVINKASLEIFTENTDTLTENPQTNQLI